MFLNNIYTDVCMYMCTVLHVIVLYTEFPNINCNVDPNCIHASPLSLTEEIKIACLTESPKVM